MNQPPQQQQQPEVKGKFKIKPQPTNIPYGHLRVLTFQMCENNNFYIFDQDPSEKQLDLRHCIMVIFIQGDDTHWITAEVGDRGNGPEIVFEYCPIPPNSKDVGIVNNQQFVPKRQDITIHELINYLNNNLAGKYYLLLRDNCYTLAHLLGQEYCAGYKGEAMEWCNKTIMRTASETTKYVANKVVDGTKEAIKQAPGLFNQGMKMGKQFLKDVEKGAKDLQKDMNKKK